MTNSNIIVFRYYLEVLEKCLRKIDDLQEQMPRFIIDARVACNFLSEACERLKNHLEHKE